MSFLFPTDTQKNLENVTQVPSMPHVFVVPPEEDETPTWCFFDAENPELPNTGEDSDVLDSDFDAFALRRNDFRSSLLIGPRSLEPISIVDALDNDQEVDEDMDTDSEYDDPVEYQGLQSLQTQEQMEDHGLSEPQDTGNDSDVIEVVRVHRRKQEHDNREERQSIQTTPEIKRSKTLKYRASKVFSSLRGTLRTSKPRAQDVFSPPAELPQPNLQNHDGFEAPEEKSDSLSRRRTFAVSRRASKIFSQIFAGPQLNTKSSGVMLDDPPRPSSPTHAEGPVSPPLSPQSDSFSQAPSRRSSFYRNAAHDERRLGATSPTFTTTSIKSKSSSMFSVSRLQKLFTFHPNSTVPEKTSNESDWSRSSTLHSNPTLFTPPSATSSASTVSSPLTPPSEKINHEPLVANSEQTTLPMFDNFDSIFDTDLGLNLGLGLSLETNSKVEAEKITTRNSFGSSRIIRSLTRTGNKVEKTQESEDPTLELRLDSFHFDELSFDIDRFVAK